VSDLLDLVTQLSPLARRHVAAALSRAGVIDGAHLGGGDVVSTLRELPPRKRSSPQVDVALGMALRSIEAELPVLTRRSQICFVATMAMALTLCGAIVWSVVSLQGGGAADMMKALAILTPTAGGSTMLAFYKHVSGQVKSLRDDLLTISRRLTEGAPLAAGH
jgi:hypothetical protein